VDSESSERILRKKGITIDAEAKSVDWKTENKLDVANGVELASVDSKTLAEIVKRMNKHSVNLYSELLLRTLGKRFGETAPDESRQIQEIRGDDSAGAAVIKKWLTENKVAADEIQIHDGSGLSRLNFVTPEAFGRALVFAAQSNFADVFKDSLPVAATDGTLGGRLGRVKGKVLAKTGSITYVNSLAGYAQASKNEIFAFAIISNNITRKKDSSRIIDAIAASLVDVQSQIRKIQTKQIQIINQKFVSQA
jgi:D-alanyl-D-alanine carboxypeptidase/D-alanyl-D-alanine-endopeptidase (penicillin-binding protein 4)